LSISVAGVPATVEFAGLSSNGLYQFNVVVPTVSDGDQTLVAQIAGQRSQATLRLRVQSPPIPAITFPASTRQNLLMCPNSSLQAPLSAGRLCDDGVTASPGEQVDFWIAGTNLAKVTGVQFIPNDGIDVSLLEVTDTFVHAFLRLAPSVVAGSRSFLVTSPVGNSNQSAGPLNISTFRISNLQISGVANTNNTLTFSTSVSYTDPTGAVSSGPLCYDVVLVAGRTAIWASSADCQSYNPPGRTPGATSGILSANRQYSNISGTTGGIFQIRYRTPDGRTSDTLQGIF
jgi:hypothetical protein